MTALPDHAENRLATDASPVLAQSINAFYRDLPELLTSRAGTWVAYHGDRFLECAATETELYQRCLRQGLPEGKFVVLFADRQALSDREVIDLPPGP